MLSRCDSTVLCGRDVTGRRRGKERVEDRTEDEEDETEGGVNDSKGGGGRGRRRSCVFGGGCCMVRIRCRFVHEEERDRGLVVVGRVALVVALGVVGVVADAAGGVVDKGLGVVLVVLPPLLLPVVSDGRSDNILDMACKAFQKKDDLLLWLGRGELVVDCVSVVSSEVEAAVRLTVAVVLLLPLLEDRGSVL